MNRQLSKPPIGLPTLDEIQARVLDGSIVPSSFYASLDCDSALDVRETHGFDDGWSHLFGQIDAAWRRAMVDHVVTDRITAICRDAHGVVDRATRHHEIAAYVANDLELIARGAVLGRDDHLLIWLWRAYRAGQFPMPWPPSHTMSREVDSWSLR